MQPTRALLLIAAVGLAAATDDSTWVQWSSSAPAPAPTPAAQGWTDWITTTEYQEKTFYNTETKTVPTTIYVTETETQVKTITATVVETTTFVQAAPPPETRTTTSFVTVTHTEVQVSVSGSVSTLAAPPPVTVTVTATQVNQVVNTATLVNTETVINTDLQTVTGLITNFVTSISVATQTVSVSYCPPTVTTPLVGLVPCTSRILNPDYTPTSKLPDNYLWGCPPGSLCKPKQVGCNFESNPPADTYICAPDECEPVADLPPPDEALGKEDVNSTCAWYTPVDDYFNLNPKLFGLDFAIFNTLGQATCTTTPPPPPPPTTSSWVPWTTSYVPPPVITTTHSPPPPPPSSSYSWVPWTTSPAPPPVTTTTSLPPAPPPSSSWQEWTTSAVVPPEPVSSSWGEWSPVSSAPVSSAWGGWSYSISSAAPEPVSSAGWNNWQQSSQSHPSYVTKRAELERRQAVIAPAACYAVCNRAGQVWQSVGKDPALCQPTGDFSQAISNVRACTDRNQPAQGVLTAVDVINDGLNYCSGLSVSAAASSTTATAESLVEATTTTTPAASASAISSTTPSATEQSQPSTTPSATQQSQSSTTPQATTPATSVSSSGTTTPSSSSSAVQPSTFTGAAVVARPMTGTLLSFILTVLAFVLRV